MKKELTMINVQEKDKKAFKKLWQEWMSLFLANFMETITQIETFELMMLVCKTTPQDKILALYHASKAGDSNGHGAESC